MKHVFLIHSHTVFLTAIGVIRRLSLKVDDIIFVYFRNYNNSIIPISYLIIRLDEEYDISNSLSAFKFYQWKKLIRRIDNVINTKIKDEYILYTPHAGSHFFQTFITHPNCTQFNYIQEGALAFDNLLSDRISFKSLIYDLFNIIIFLLNQKRIWCSYKWTLKKDIVIEKKTPTCFAITEKIFEKLLYATIIVEWPKVNPEYIIDNRLPIFVFESSVEQGIVEKEKYFLCIRQLIETKAEQKNYLKFHPYQSTTNKKDIVDLFKEYNLDIEILPDSIPFELFLTFYNNLKVVGFRSSLLVYAQQLGHKTFSKEPDLIKMSRRYRAIRKEMNEI